MWSTEAAREREFVSMELCGFLRGCDGRQLTRDSPLSEESDGGSTLGVLGGLPQDSGGEHGGGVGGSRLFRKG